MHLQHDLIFFPAPVNVLPGVERGMLDMGPEPGEEFLIQKAKEMGISIPGDDLPQVPSYDPTSRTTGPPPFNRSYSDPSLGQDIGFRSSFLPETAFSAQDPSAMSMADPGTGDIRYFNVNGHVRSGMRLVTAAPLTSHVDRSNFVVEDNRPKTQFERQYELLENMNAPFHPKSGYLFYWSRSFTGEKK